MTCIPCRTLLIPVRADCYNARAIERLLAHRSRCPEWQAKLRTEYRLWAGRDVAALLKTWTPTAGQEAALREELV